MPSKVTVPIRPQVLAWARRSASVGVDEAAKAAGVKPDRLEAWEAGEDTPSLPQLRRLADKYHRPLAVMLLPEPPRDFNPLKDYRRIDLGASGHGALPPRVAYEIRLAQERREIALEMVEEIGSTVTKFPLAATTRDDPEKVGIAFRAFFGVRPADIQRWAAASKVFEGWRGAIEARDILVFVMGGPHGPPIKEVRGFAIPQEILPVVAVNGKDRTNGRTFTLLHEVAHLMLSDGAIENTVAPFPGMPPAVRRIERWCNAVAAATLMPVELVEAVAGKRGPDTEWSDADLAYAASRLGVSREAALIRLVSLRRASAKSYFRRRPDFDEEYAKLDEPLDTKAIVPSYRAVVGRVGRPYTRLVISGYREKRITLNDAAAFLGVQAKHIGYLEQQAFKAA